MHSNAYFESEVVLFIPHEENLFKSAFVRPFDTAHLHFLVESLFFKDELTDQSECFFHSSTCDDVTNIWAPARLNIRGFPASPVRKSTTLKSGLKHTTYSVVMHSLCTQDTKSPSLSMISLSFMAQKHL